jgi:four helix bundle protein
MARPHQKLHAWQQAMRLVKMTYVATQEFPREELYGLTTQVRRAAVSIPSNIAEGAARSTKKEFAQFVSISKGSLSELDTQMLIASELGYLSPEHEIFGHLERVGQLLSGLHKNVANQSFVRASN